MATLPKNQAELLAEIIASNAISYDTATWADNLRRARGAERTRLVRALSRRGLVKMDSGNVWATPSGCERMLRSTWLRRSGWYDDVVRNAEDCVAESDW